MGKKDTAGARPAKVNDFLAGDPGSTATAGRRLPAMPAPADDLSETEISFHDGPGDDFRTVALPLGVLRVLLLASDSACERVRAGISNPSQADLDFLASLAYGGLVDSVTLRPMERLETAIAQAGQVAGFAGVRLVRDGSFSAEVDAAERLIAGCNWPFKDLPPASEDGGAQVCEPKSAPQPLPAAGSFSAG